MYIELDHDLQPGKIENINKRNQQLGTGESQDNVRKIERKWDVHHGDLAQSVTDGHFALKAELIDGQQSKFSEYQVIAGTKCDIYFDHDWGFFAAVLACYNNHWVLKTSPDDWWNVIVRVFAQAIDSNGDEKEVRKFFVNHEGKEPIKIEIGTINDLGASWLYGAFTKKIRQRIKTPGYVGAMEANFSTTSPDQLVSSRVMIMSSLQKYFTYEAVALCGIPGVEMTGTLEDWELMLQKFRALKNILAPILEAIHLQYWCSATDTMLGKLIDTFKGNPDRDWWGHITCYYNFYGSGGQNSFEGWFLQFIKAGKADKPKDFQSGCVSVPLKISETGSEAVEGQLIAGTFGYTVEEGQRAPIVQAKQGWLLLVPKSSWLAEQATMKKIY